MAITPLSAEDVGPYIQHRWGIAGGKEAPFSAEAVACIGQATHGIPRLINVTCDNALIEAYADESARVEARHVIGACRDLHLSAPVPRLSPPIPQRAPAPPALCLRTGPWTLIQRRRWSVTALRRRVGLPCWAGCAASSNRRRGLKPREQAVRDVVQEQGRDRGYGPALG